MKKILLIGFISLFFSGVGISQTWLKLLPQNKSNSELSFYDYQNAFDKYWSNYQIDNGFYIDKNGKKQKAYGWKQFKRWEYFWQYRIDKKTGQFPSIDANKILKNSSVKNGGNWICLGTDSTEGGYAGIGRIATVAFHPTDTNIYWIGAPAGGLWGTTDAGQTWTVFTDSNAVLGVSAIVIPSDYDISHTIYIGTGDRDAMDNYSVGILKSSDSGLTWDTTGLVFNPADKELVNNMRVSPIDDSTIYAATTDGLYITTDAGDTWTKTYNGEFVDIEICPSFPDTLYGSTRGGEIYRSLDGGENWTNVYSSAGNNRVELAVTADNPAIVYAAGANSADGLYAIFKSSDFGETFSVIYDDKNLLDWFGGTGTGGQGWYDLALAADPNDSNIVYIGGVNTWESLDGGENWMLVSHWYGGLGVPAVHADKHFMAFRNDESVLFECNDGGVYSTEDGTNWSHHTNGITISQIYGLSVSQQSGNQTIVGLQDNGTKQDSSSKWRDVLGGDGMLCQIDYADEDVQYGSQYRGSIYRTTDNWIDDYVQISTNIPSGEGNWVTPYEIDPIDHNTIYVGYSNLWKSTDMGDSFESIGSFGGNLSRIAICPTNNKYIYVTIGSSIQKTSNGGLNWDNISNGLPLGDASITYIAVKYNDPKTVWVTLSGYNQYGVYKTTDGGNSWIDISAGLPEIPVNCIIQNNLESTFEQLYAGTDFGIYIKQGDSTWTRYSKNLPNVVVSDLDIYYDYQTPSNSKLRASTYGRGLWESDLQLSGLFAPFVNTENVQNVSYNTVDLLGNITNDFNSTISESGILLGQSKILILEDTNIIKIPTNPVVVSDTFTVTATNLQSGTQYYYRAYAKNSNGIGYGAVKQFVTSCEKVNSFAWTEDVENNGDFPLCFSQEFIENNLNWKVSSSNAGNPDNAHSGDYFFVVKKDGITQGVTRLLLPRFDLSGLAAAQLNFWLYNAPVFNVTDTLFLYYKTSISDSWTLLTSFDNSITEWTNFSVNLPNISDDYQLAFQANIHSDRGIAIDDILIDLNTNLNVIDDDFVISPIPSKGVVFISGNVDNYEVQVYDINGRSILKISLNKNFNKIDLSNFNNGIYILKIKTSDKIVTRKIIIEK